MKNHYTLGLYPLSKNSYRIGNWGWFAHYLNPKTYYLTVKYFCQRGYHGYSGCDHWDANSYLEAVILGIIKDLKDKTHGYPSDFSKSTDGFEDWKFILNEIIEGLEASIELRNETTVPDDTYSDQPIEFEEIEGSKGQLYKIKDTGTPMFDINLYQEWAKPLEEKKKKALQLLNKYWECFWD